MIDYTQSPAYQRLMQRAGRIRPENMAVLRPMISGINAKFASESAGKELTSLGRKRDVDYANRSLGLRERAMTSDTGLRRQAFDENVRQNRISTGVGLGQVAAEAKYGMDRDAIDMETFKKKMEFMNRLPQLYGGA